MTDTDSIKVIEKLNEVIELLKTTKDTSTVETCAKNCKCNEINTDNIKDVPKEIPKEITKEIIKDKKIGVCPFRKLINSQDFEQINQIVKSNKNMCISNNCPFLIKKIQIDEINDIDDFNNVDELTTNSKLEKNENYQIFNIILSILVLILLIFSITNFIKRFYFIF